MSTEKAVNFILQLGGGEPIVPDDLDLMARQLRDEIRELGVESLDLVADNASSRTREIGDMLSRAVVPIAVAVIALTLGFGCTAFRPKPGEAFPSQGREHIAPGESHPAYNSNPPTSGWHYAQAAPPGAYRQEIPDEILIHNLEHGCVWISYKDPKNTELVEKLDAIAARYPTSVVLAPRPKNDSAIAVAAWQRLLKIETFDQDQIEEFIKAWRNKAPESLNCAG